MTVSDYPGRAGPPAQAIILAAGRGGRLKEETADRPKCLVDVGGRTLIEHQIGALSAFGVLDVCVVAGYRGDLVEDALSGVARVVHNDIWADTESLYSLWLCRDRIQGTVMILNCDVLADDRILGRVLANGESTFAFDSSSGSHDEHMKVELADGCLKSMSKDLPAARCHGENVGILCFTGADTVRLREQVEEIQGRGEKRARATQAVENFARSVPLRGLDIAGLLWIEIDFPDDLERARREIWPHVRTSAGREAGDSHVVE